MCSARIGITSNEERGVDFGARSGQGKMSSGTTFEAYNTREG